MPYFPDLTADAPFPLPGDSDWYFELVFDYGEHDRMPRFHRRPLSLGIAGPTRFLLTGPRSRFAPIACADGR